MFPVDGTGAILVLYTLQSLVFGDTPSAIIPLRV